MIGDESKVFPGSGVQIRHKGRFDLDSLYKDVREWFKSRNYIFTEKEQTTKDKTLGKEMIIRWEGWREVDDYAKFMIEIEFFIENVNKIKDGYDGSVKITLFSKVILDYKNKFKSSSFKQILAKIYNNFIIKKKIKEVYEAKLMDESKELQNLIKDKLGMMKE